MGLEEELGSKANWIHIDPPLMSMSCWTTVYKVKLPKDSRLLKKEVLTVNRQKIDEAGQKDKRKVEKESEDLVFVKKVSAVKRVPHDPRSEIETLSNLNHPNIIKLLTSFQPPKHSNFYLIFPLYKLTLHDLLNLNNPIFKPSPAPNKAIKSDFWEPKKSSTEIQSKMSDYFYRITRIIFKDLTGALNYLHGLGIGHRDLSPSNIALDFGFRAILLDFGTVWDPRFREQGGSKLDFELGTMPYRAPELLFGSQDYSVTGIDLWSLGTILAEFFTPLEPIEEYHKRELSFQGDEYDNSKSQLSDNAFDWYCGGYGDNQKRSNKLRRRNLFRGDIGDIGLVGSIFKILGTPDNDSWPESKSLPDFSKLEFHKFEVKDLRDNLPYLHSVEDENKESGNENNEISLLIDLIKGLLKLSSSKRLKADQVLENPWLKDKKLDLDDYSKTEISKLWKTL